MNSAGSLDLKGMHFLVVDNSWHVGKDLKAILEGLGADVTGPAPTAPQARGLIAEHTPDLAFVDVKLRDGELAYDLIDYLHERGIRVIVISGYALPQQRERNVAAILQKPVTKTELLATLRSVTMKKRGADATPEGISSGQYP
jgi:CheY-like chemotaxis protein